MSAHLATERLSAYLDQELDGRDLRLVEEHVHECAHCQHRLHGLRRVVDELQRMPAVRAPSILGRAVDRDASERWRARREAAFRGRQGQNGSELVPGLIQLGSALVVAGSIVLLLLLHSMTRSPSPTRGSENPDGGVDVSSPGLDRAVAGGRPFVFDGGTWWQQDVGGSLGTGTDEPTVVPIGEALARAPWLSELLRRGSVVLELDGETVRVEAAVGATAPREE